MIAGQHLTGAEFTEALAGYQHTAFRLEVQTPRYNEPSERAVLAAFLDGTPPDPASVPEFAAWFAQVAQQRAEGRRMSRVRVHDDPPTGYQRFEQWLGPWNGAAGEDITYLTQAMAWEIGLLPDAGRLGLEPSEPGLADWWLLDSTSLIVMYFDKAQRRVADIWTDDPAIVIKAARWRDLSTHYAVRLDLPGVAA